MLLAFTPLFSTVKERSSALLAPVKVALLLSLLTVLALLVMVVTPSPEPSMSTYSFSVKPRFATGLQVVKDPGVWTVYFGCIMMIVGLIIIFYLSHKRIWVFISKEDNSDNSTVIIAGLSNKNKIGFEHNMAALYEEIESNSLLEFKNS